MRFTKVQVKLVVFLSQRKDLRIARWFSSLRKYFFFLLVACCSCRNARMTIQPENLFKELLLPSNVNFNSAYVYSWIKFERLVSFQYNYFEKYISILYIYISIWIRFHFSKRSMLSCVIHQRIIKK